MKMPIATVCLSLVVGVASVGIGAAADYQKGLDAARKGDFATAFREWKPLAEQGDAVAQYILGAMYDVGEGVVEDDREAVRWYRLAAE